MYSSTKKSVGTVCFHWKEGQEEEGEEGKEGKAEEEADKEAMWFESGISKCHMENGPNLPGVPKSGS